MAGYPNWSDGGGGGRPPIPPPPQLQQHQKPASWLLPDYTGSIHSRPGFPGPPPMPPPPQPLLGGYGYGGGGYQSNARQPQHSRAASEVSFDTSAKDPESVRARVFIGSLNNGQSFVAREDVIELCLPYGPLRGVTFFKMQGYAFVQFEEADAADAACRELNGVRWKGCVLDVHPVDQQQTRGSSSSSSATQSVKAVPTTNYDEIGQDTSSKDPQLMRARVFIGSLAYSSPPINRNDVIELCLPYGKITAVTFFKMQGYAFIQFESPVDAVTACDKLNGLNWKGNAIDVHLAMEGANRKRATPEDYGSSSSSKEYGSLPVETTAMDWSGAPTQKRLREQEEQPAAAAFSLHCRVCRWRGADLAEFLQHREQGGCKERTRSGEPPSLACSSCEAVLPSAWRLLFHLHDDQAPHRLRLVTVDKSEAVLAKAREADEKNKKEWWSSVERWLDAQHAAEEGEVDDEEDERTMKGVTGLTVVCGACGLVADDWHTFAEHRKRDCIKPRDPLEPSCLVCAMCGEAFVSAWKALFHLIDFHRMKLFSPDYTKEAAARSAVQFARESRAVEKRMKMWIDSHGL